MKAVKMVVEDSGRDAFDVFTFKRANLPQDFTGSRAVKMRFAFKLNFAFDVGAELACD